MLLSRVGKYEKEFLTSNPSASSQKLTSVA